jgi:hypothetical protein
MEMTNNPVSLEFNGRVQEFEFEHAQEILRQQEKQGNTVFTIVSNHEFINNHVIITRPVDKSGTVSEESGTAPKRRKVSK